MKVFLLQTIPSIGKAGNVVEVKDGFARNSLLPKGSAALPNSLTVKNYLSAIEKDKLKQNKIEQHHKEKAQSIDGKSYTLSAKAGVSGKIFGSVTKNDLADLIGVDKDQIILEQSIKSLGEYQIRLDFGQKIHSQITLKVVPHE